jgi:hypothetical protein
MLFTHRLWPPPSTTRVSAAELPTPLLLSEGKLMRPYVRLMLGLEMVKYLVVLLRWW